MVKSRKAEEGGAAAAPRKRAKTSVATTEAGLETTLVEKLLAQETQNTRKGTENDAEYWKKMYTELRDLRETGPEARMVQLQKRMKQQQERFTEAVESLREQQQGDSAVDTTSGLEADLEQKCLQVKLYQHLTGCVLQLPEDAEEEGEADDFVANCVVVNHQHQKATKFRVHFPADQSTTEVRLVPTGGRQHLPSDLQVPCLRRCLRSATLDWTSSHVCLSPPLPFACHRMVQPSRQKTPPEFSAEFWVVCGQNRNESAVERGILCG